MIDDEQARAARYEYFREYRRKNRERLNAYRREWERKNHDKRQAYREANKDRINAYQRKWRKEHPAKCREYERRYWRKRAEAAASCEAHSSGAKY